MYSLATAGADYGEDEGQIIFETNQTSANIAIMIYNDDIPELDESIFIRLTGAYLFQEGGSGGNGEEISLDTIQVVLYFFSSYWCENRHRLFIGRDHNSRE